MHEIDFYPVVKEAFATHLIAEGYSSDLEITGGRGMVPQKFLRDGLLHTYREKGLPTPDIIGFVTRRWKKDKQLLGACPTNNV